MLNAPSIALGGHLLLAEIEGFALAELDRSIADRAEWAMGDDVGIAPCLASFFGACAKPSEGASSTPVLRSEGAEESSGDLYGVFDALGRLPSLRLVAFDGKDGYVSGIGEEEMSTILYADEGGMVALESIKRCLDAGTLIEDLAASMEMQEEIASVLGGNETLPMLRIARPLAAILARAFRGEGVLAELLGGLSALEKMDIRQEEAGWDAAEQSLAA